MRDVRKHNGATDILALDDLLKQSLCWYVLHFDNSHCIYVVKLYVIDERDTVMEYVHVRQISLKCTLLGTIIRVPIPSGAACSRVK